MEERFGEYRLIRALGKGAMGEVFLAHDEVLDRPVALKLVAGDKRVGSEPSLFEEARVAARLTHPNVVTVHRVGEHDGRTYIVSELIRGDSLDHFPKPMPWARVLSIGIGLSRGLGAAHRAGVLHRDVKPANAMMTEDGTVKLVDFGLATRDGVAASRRGLDHPATSDMSLAALSATVSFVAPDVMAAGLVEGDVSRLGRARPGAIPLVGTPFYMAPELWRGEPATRRSDVYALGTLLYELCTGAPPHASRTMGELVEAIAHEDAPPLARMVPGIDPRFAAIVDRCVARSPSTRPESAEELRDALEELEARPAPPTPEGNPYRGLASFDAAHRGLFFGRARDARAIVERLRGEGLVILVGDSGVGKSSLVRAGVAPAIRDGALGDGAWTVIDVAPGRRPVASMAAALAPVMDRSEAELAALLRDAPADAARDLRAVARDGKPLLLCIDALEELVSLAGADEAAAIAELLSELALVAARVRVLGSARSDFVTRLARVPRLGDAMSRALYIVRPLDESGLRAAIVEPARAKGVSFEPPSLVDQVADAARTEGALPLLQFALAELWDARDQRAHAITAASLGTLGGVNGALARHADAVIASLMPSARAAARRILVRLVAADGTRARRLASEVVGDDADARAAIDALVRGRLLSARDDPEGPAYELAHEALVGAWKTLRDWVADDGDQRILVERLARAAAEWERLGRAHDALWGPRQLGEVQLLEAPATLRVTGLREREFLRASRRSIRGARVRRTLAVAAVPVLAAAVYAGVRFDAQRSTTRRVDGSLGEARSLVVEGRRLHDESDGEAREAFARFDARRRDEGEEAWSRARAHAASSARALAGATRAAETALLFDPSRADARALLADVIFARALAAQANGDEAAVEELIARLGLYDQGGAYMRKWNAPARLDAEVPASARVGLERFEAGPSGGGRWIELRPEAPGPLHAELPAGSYRLRVRGADGRVTLDPLVLARAEERQERVRLAQHASVPARFIYVPPGRFLTGSGDDERQRKDYLKAAPLHERTTGAFFIDATETTYGDWIAWLDALPPGERETRLPRANSVGVQGDVALRRTAGGWELRLQPAGSPMIAGEGEPLRYVARRENAVQRWTQMPVSGISPRDARAYVSWLATSGRVPGARLCKEEEWERAARGADGRMYPSGQQLLPGDVNESETYGTAGEAHGPDEVGLHPSGDSPFGVHDMAGNVFEMVDSEGAGDVEIARGGSFAFDSNAARTELREQIEPDLRDITMGVRVCLDAVVPQTDD